MIIRTKNQILYMLYVDYLTLLSYLLISHLAWQDISELFVGVNRIGTFSIIYIV